MLNRWQRTIVDLRGNVVPYAQLQIRVESTQATATIYADRAGNELIPNGIVTADANGYAYFYAKADLYRISSMQPTIDWRYVDIGSAGALQRGNNLSDVADPATARNNLGLGSAASADVVEGTGGSEHDVMSQKAVTDALNTKANVSNPGSMGLGVGQTWQDVTGSRVAGTTYTNTTGRTILVAATASEDINLNVTITGLVDSQQVVQSTVTAPGGNGGVASITFAVPPGASYRCNLGTGDTLRSWVELR